MDVNDYLLGKLVWQRLDEIRVAARCAALAPPRRPLRVIVGEALIRLGTLVLGTAARSSPTLASRAS